MVVVQATDITVDGDPSDWSGLSPADTDPNESNVDDEYDIGDFYFTESDNNATLYLRFDLYDKLVFNDLGQIVVYFDVDQSTSTGLDESRFFGPFGADYRILVYNVGGFYSKSVQEWTGSAWSTLGTGATMQFAFDDDIVEVGIAFAAVGISSEDCFNLGIHFENFSNSEDDNVLGEYCDDPTAANLSSFTVSMDDASMIVEWQTADELDVTGFNVWRSTDTADHGMQLNSAIIPAQTPGELTGNLYTYVDDTALPNSHYYYWLEVKQVNAISAWYGPVEPIRFRLYLPVLLRGE